MLGGVFKNPETSPLSLTHLHLACFLADPQSSPEDATAVQLVFNPFIQFLSQAKLYSPLQVSLRSDPIVLGIPNSTY